MLNPRSRHQLFDALRPPVGMHLDFALGTTFTIDLLALLTTPLAFTLFEWDQSPQRNPDPVKMLATMQQYAQKIVIFCQKGQIKVPQTTQLLYGYLEESVVQVQSPSINGVFHPKVWGLRYTNPAQDVIYRLLCLSRNLTYDRSWDTLLILNGELTSSLVDHPNPEPIVRFFTALPQFADHNGIPDRLHTMLDVLQKELPRVAFTLPEGCERLTFHPLGIGPERQWPFPEHVDRLLVVSPFVSSPFPQRIAHMTHHKDLVSRLETLTALPSTLLQTWNECFVLSPDANPEEEQEVDPEASPPDTQRIEKEPSSSKEEDEAQLTGLHAKLYIAEMGKKAHIWTGSANATNAAFHENIEFLVELVGTRQHYGIDALYYPKQLPGFRDLLMPFTPHQAPEKPDPVRQEMEHELDKVRTALTRQELVAHVERLNDTPQFCVTLSQHETSSHLLSAGATIRCWPITLHPNTGVLLDVAVRQIAHFPVMSYEALTAFFAFEVSIKRQNQSAACQFVLMVRLDNAPADRTQHILRSILSSPDAVLKFLALLLADDSPDARRLLETLERQTTDTDPLHSRTGAYVFPLLESMLRLLTRNPARLDAVARLVDDLCQTDEGKHLLPKGFLDLWTPIWTTRERLSHDTHE